MADPDRCKTALRWSPCDPPQRFHLLLSEPSSTFSYIDPCSGAEAGEDRNKHVAGKGKNGGCLHNRNGASQRQRMLLAFPALWQCLGSGPLWQRPPRATCVTLHPQRCCNRSIRHSRTCGGCGCERAFSGHSATSRVRAGGGALQFRCF